MLHDSYHHKKEADTQAERMRLIKTAAQVYPSKLDNSDTNIAKEYLPIFAHNSTNNVVCGKG